jgi:hypothetical protein
MSNSSEALVYRTGSDANARSALIEYDWAIIERTLRTVVAVLLLQTGAEMSSQSRRPLLQVSKVLVEEMRADDYVLEGTGTDPVIL